MSNHSRWTLYLSVNNDPFITAVSARKTVRANFLNILRATYREISIKSLSEMASALANSITLPENQNEYSELQSIDCEGYHFVFRARNISSEAKQKPIVRANELDALAHPFVQKYLNEHRAFPSGWNVMVKENGNLLFTSKYTLIKYFPTRNKVDIVFLPYTASTIEKADELAAGYVTGKAVYKRIVELLPTNETP